MGSVQLSGFDTNQSIQKLNIEKVEYKEAIASKNMPQGCIFFY